MNAAGFEVRWESATGACCAAGQVCSEGRLQVRGSVLVGEAMPWDNPERSEANLRLVSRADGRVFASELLLRHTPFFGRPSSKQCGAQACTQT